MTRGHRVRPLFPFLEVQHLKTKETDGATVKVFADAGHMSQMEKANDFNALLKKHLGG